MELELRHLRVLCRLDETGSVSKAAAALGVSQPALTAQLHRVEQAIGGPLFERGPHGVVPTPLGRHVLGRARAMLAEMDDLVATSRRATTRPVMLRLGSIRTVMFGAWLSRLETALPGREITTRLDSAGAVLTGLLAAELVDVLMLGRFDDEHAPACPAGALERTMIHPEPFGVALPATHRLAGQTEVALADLADDTWLSPPGGAEDGDMASLRDACEAVGFTPRFRYTNLETAEIEQLLAAGLGVILCAPTVRPAANVVIRPLAGQPLRWRRVLRWRPVAVSEAECDAIHRAFIEAYRETLDQHATNQPWWTSHPQARPVIADCP